MTERKELQKATPKQEAQPREGVERTRQRKAYVPRTDIYETDQAIHVAAEMPGVSEQSTEVTLENGVLTLRGFVEPAPPEEGLALSHAEYQVGDYERAFTVSEEIDQDKITAKVRDGVLELTLPKSEKAKTRKIPVSTE